MQRKTTHLDSAIKHGATTKQRKTETKNWKKRAFVYFIFIAAASSWFLVNVAVQHSFISCINMQHARAEGQFTPFSLVNGNNGNNGNNDVTLLSNQHAITQYDGPSRAFTKFSHKFPCFPGEEGLMQTTPAHEGILFQRPTKTGSTTMVGITLRLVHNQAKMANFSLTEDGSSNNSAAKIDRDGIPQTDLYCKHRAMHGSAMALDYRKRHHTKSFLFSLIRNPHKRIASAFFHFQSSVHQIEPTDINYIDHCRSTMYYDSYMYDLNTRNYTSVRKQTKTAKIRAAKKGTTIDPKLLRYTREEFAVRKGFNSTMELNKYWSSGLPGTQIMGHQFKAFQLFGDTPIDEIVEDILDDYNFIGLLERLDESLVIFQMLLGLTTKDILYTRARSAGSFSNGLGDRPCVYIKKPFTTPGMKRYFESEEWQELVYGDYRLYQAVNASLDRTIDALGRAEFDANLQKLKAALVVTEAHCNGRVRTMCDESGQPIPPQNRTCYIWGEGCDHECVNEVQLS